MIIYVYMYQSPRGRLRKKWPGLTRNTILSGGATGTCRVFWASRTCSIHFSSLDVLDLNSGSSRSARIWAKLRSRLLHRPQCRDLLALQNGWLPQTSKPKQPRTKTTAYYNILPCLAVFIYVCSCLFTLFIWTYIYYYIIFFCLFAVLLQNGCSKLMPAMDLQNGWCHQSSKATKNQNYIKRLRSIQYSCML